MRGREKVASWQSYIDLPNGDGNDSAGKTRCPCHGGTQVREEGLKANDFIGFERAR
jgi:hypothetical protein